MVFPTIMLLWVSQQLALTQWLWATWTTCHLTNVSAQANCPAAPFTHWTQLSPERHSSGVSLGDSQGERDRGLPTEIRAQDPTLTAWVRCILLSSHKWPACTCSWEQPSPKGGPKGYRVTSG